MLGAGALSFGALAAGMGSASCGAPIRTSPVRVAHPNLRNKPVAGTEKFRRFLSLR